MRAEKSGPGTCHGLREPVLILAIDCSFARRHPTRRNPVSPLNISDHSRTTPNPDRLRFLNVARWGGDRLRTVTLTLNPRHDSTTPSPTCSSHVTQSLPIHTTCAHPDGGVCTPRWGGLERQESRLSLPLFLPATPYVILY